MATLDEIDAQIRQLEDQKKQLVQKAKDEQIKKATDAIAALKAMGFNYRLAELGDDRPVPIPKGGGTRRTGIRDQVLALVKKHGVNGVARAQILTALDAADKSSQQSISNALAALKKAGSVTLAGGLYKAK